MLQRFDLMRDRADQLIRQAERIFGSSQTESRPAEPAPAEPADSE
jgi:hypothetical protein